MAALEVKRGDRKRLQHENATHGPNVGMVVNSTTSNSNDPSRANVDSERRLNASSFSRPRKYRRHPKPDVNAPKRPLTAYVRFSNDKREEYRENGWSFPQLAKKIGQDWRCLPNQRRMEYLTDAEEEKRKSHSALERYRKTEEYRTYQTYLKDFNDRHRPGKMSKAGGPSDTPSDDASLDQDDSSHGADPIDQYSVGGSQPAWSPVGRDYIDFHNPIVSSQPELAADSDLATGQTFNNHSGFVGRQMMSLPVDDMASIFATNDDNMPHMFAGEQHGISHQLRDHINTNGLNGDPLGLLTSPSYPYYVQ